MDTDTLDLRSILSLFRRQISLILMTTALMLALAIGYLAIVKPVYTATALVMVDTAQKSLVFADNQNSSASTDNAKVESEVEILKSPTVALAVVRDANLISDPEFGPKLSTTDKIRQALGFETANDTNGDAVLQGVLGRFSNAITVRRRGLTYLIAASVASQSPTRAAELANALTAAYIQAQVDSKIAGTLGARDKLQTQITAAKEALSNSEDAIDTYIDRNLERIEKDSGRTDIAEMRKSLESLESEKLSAEVKAAESRSAMERQDWASLAQSLGDQGLAELQSQRDSLEKRLAGTASGSADEVDLRTALAKLQDQQEAQAQAAIASVTGQASALDGNARDLRSQIRDTLLTGQISSQFVTELYQLQQEGSVARNQYQELLSRMRELETQAAVQLADARVVSPALPPNAASFPNKKLVLVMALVGGLGLGVGLAFLNDYFVGGITSESQLRDILRARVATAVPLLALKPETELSIADNVVTAPLSPYAEAIRRLRASLEIELRKVPRERDEAGHVLGQTVVVTSSIPAEGKSTTALALARAFSLSDRSVIIIDADLRKPTVHKLTGLSPAKGLIDYLSDPHSEAMSETLVLRDPLTAVSLIPGAGRAHKETDQLLGSDIFAQLVRVARQSFDIVVIDTPPVLPVVDTRYLAGFGDAVVMVVRFGMTGQSDLRSSVQTLSEVIRPGVELQTVLNHQPKSGNSYRYNSYYEA
ncbi:GumC family protein [Phaeovulum sp. W22_SRMD_FR3]|uniref:GumC family protein n=1 Tax=Phaeovulum sp. W22_SRMD_FR3 TaxID=3240274 RepID=UPI003F965164